MSEEPQQHVRRDVCAIEDCDSGVAARGWCTLHYTRWRRNGHPLANKEPDTLAARFWKKVQIPTSEGDTEHGCWLWTGATDSNGYGVLSIEGPYTERAHRVSWCLHFGAVAPHGQIRHVCGNRACVRPTHLVFHSDAKKPEELSPSQQREAEVVCASAGVEMSEKQP